MKKNKKHYDKYKKFDVVYADFGRNPHGVQGGIRPGIVVSNKYKAALAKYNTNLSDADIQARVAELIEKKVPENNTEDFKKFLFNCIDLTTLNSTDTVAYTHLDVYKRQV